MMDALRLAVTLAVLYALHQYADHWVQTHHQAVTKGQCHPEGHPREGRATLPGLRALTGHITTLTLAMAAGMLFLVLRFPALDWNLSAVAAGLVVNSLSHAWADHRPNLRALAHRIGKADYYDKVPGGAYQLDQAWHYGWLLISTLIIAI